MSFSSSAGVFSQNAFLNPRPAPTPPDHSSNKLSSIDNLNQYPKRLNSHSPTNSVTFHHDNASTGNASPTSASISNNTTTLANVMILKVALSSTAGLSLRRMGRSNCGIKKYSSAKRIFSWVLQEWGKNHIQVPKFENYKSPGSITKITEYPSIPPPFFFIFCWYCCFILSWWYMVSCFLSVSALTFVFHSF